MVERISKNIQLSPLGANVSLWLLFDGDSRAWSAIFIFWKFVRFFQLFISTLTQLLYYDLNQEYESFIFTKNNAKERLMNILPAV